MLQEAKSGNSCQAQHRPSGCLLAFLVPFYIKQMEGKEARLCRLYCCHFHEVKNVSAPVWGQHFSA